MIGGPLFRSVGYEILYECIRIYNFYHQQKHNTIDDDERMTNARPTNNADLKLEENCNPTNFTTCYQQVYCTVVGK